MMDDEMIMDLFFDRSEQAIGETEQKYGKYCFSVSWRILENREDCEECVNDTWLSAWNSIPPKRPDCLRGFLGRICRTSHLTGWIL